MMLSSYHTITPLSHRHVLIFFGGLAGLEPAIESDETLKETEPRTLFDYYLNVCPDQGSRTIRTEEALFITLAALRKQLSDNGMNWGGFREEDLGSVRRAVQGYDRKIVFN